MSVLLDGLGSSWRLLMSAGHFQPGAGGGVASGSVTGSVAPPTIYNPLAHAVAWEGTLLTGTVQEIRFQVALDIAGTGSLSLPIVNTAWLTDTESRIGVSAMVIVNGWRVHLPLIVRRSWAPVHTRCLPDVQESPVIEQLGLRVIIVPF